MKKEENLAFQEALKRLKILEKENNILKAENTKISKGLIDEKTKSASVSALLKSKEKECQELTHSLSKKDEIIKEKEQDIADRDALIIQQKEELENLKKYLIDQKIMTQKAVNALFGKSSAKTQNLVKGAISTGSSLPKKEKKESKRRGRKPGTHNFSDWDENNYQQEEIHYELPEEQRVCPSCGHMMEKKGEVRYIKLVFVPSHIRKIIINLDNYNCPNCGENVTAKDENTDCFGKSACTSNFAGYICLLSGGLYLPANRISDLFSYNGTPISRVLITKYLNKTGELLHGFVELMRKKMQKTKVLMFDETVWYTTNDKDTETNRIWGMTTGPREENQAVYFMYSTTRKNDNFSKILEDDYDGAIVSDAYSAYLKHELHQLCWSHLRKYLFDYLKASNAPESVDYKQINELLDKCNLVFAKERELSSLPEKEIEKRRKSELKPLIDDYFSTAEKYYDSDINDAKNKAINYGLKNKEKYYTFVDDPKIPCTNNRSESSMRKVVMKRVASMFSTSIEGAKSMCVILSLVQSARMNHISPDKYIETLLTNIEDLKDERKAISYLPWSKTIKDKISFTKQEIFQATKEVEVEMESSKKPGNP